jgi:AAA15 family ATPase/GTPase
MLLGMRVANYRSLRDPQHLDLRSVYGPDRKAAVTVAAIYGANASGKSNLLDAIRFMHDAVTEQKRGWQADAKDIPRMPFRLDSDSRSAPSSFAVELLLEGVRYNYGFTVDDKRILEEWCYSYPKRKRRLLFERSPDGVRLGSSLQGTRGDLLAEMTPPNLLLLSTAERSQHQMLMPVYSWFRSSLWFADDENASQRRRQTYQLLTDPAQAPRVESLLTAADLGITGIRVKSIHIQVKESPARRRTKDAPPAPGSRLVLESKHDSIEVAVEGNISDIFDLIDMAVASPQSMIFTHAGDARADFVLAEESRGTREWFDLLGFTLLALQNGWTLIVDELDTSLHPLLLAQLVRLFQDAELNPKRAQLVFTTHDVSLLGHQHGEELLKRDEIWFLEKDRKSGASSLYPLTDFKPREGLNWERRYLGGSVGAIPFVDEEHLARVPPVPGSSDDE